MPPLPTRELTSHNRQITATLHLLGLLANLYISYEKNSFAPTGRILLLSIPTVARFVKRMSKINR